MKVVNRTPFQFAPFAGRLTFPGATLTLIVKGTFDLANGGTATPAEEQQHVTGDLFHPDDPDMAGSCRYESDFAYFKPRADLLLAGSCHTPGGRPAQECMVTFQVGDRSRRLLVSGDRFWVGPPGLRTISDPEPFTRMELRFENSYGGNGFQANPVGKGYRSQARALPNIEDPDRLIDSPGSRSGPSGFGPLGRTWEERAAMLGTYKGRWAEERWPWFPEDFDYAHFNAAPRSMQVEGYLRGDENLHFENLHPEHARYSARLPGLRVRCFLHDRVTDQEEETRFREVPLGLDTLWADMDAEKLVLVWRGWTEVRSDDFEEVQHVFLMAESVHTPPTSIELCHELFLATLAQAQPRVEETPEPPAEEPIPESGPAPSDLPAGSAGLRKEVEAQVDALLARAGIRLDTLPPQARETARMERNRILDAVTDADPARARAREMEAARLRMSEALARVGIDPNHLPPVSEAAAREQARLLREMGVEDVDRVFRNPTVAGFLSIMAALLPKVGIDPEDLTPLIAQAKKHRAQTEPPGGEAEGPAEAPPEGEGPRPWTRERVAERAARGGSFAGEDLRELDLSHLELKGIDFSGADLSGAVLAEADLTTARLSQACLAGADLTRAKLPGAVLTGAKLANAVFVDAEMAGAVLDRVQAAGALFVAADLAGARLTDSDFPGADFSRGTLSGTDFSASNLTDAFIEGAVCADATFEEADLTRLRASEGTDFSGSSFVKSWGPESIWGKANLAGADFSFARMEGASFMGAILKNADLHAADMKRARFIKADLEGARLVEMNLFEGSMEKANLTEADLTGSNMYGVEFHGAVLSGATLTGTNLRMTTLQKV